MSDAHLNVCPDYVPLKELAHWGEQHSDPWVRKLATIVGDLAYSFPDPTDLNDFVDNLKHQVQEMENDLANAYSDLEQTEREVEIFRDKVKSLQLQLDASESAQTIDGLRARIYDLNEHVKVITNHRNRDAEKYEKTYQDLLKRYNDIEHKLNTWTVLST